MKKLIRIFFSKKQNRIPSGEIFTNLVIEIFNNSSRYYKKRKDLVYFKNVNAFGVFKYSAVKDILINNEAIGVSTIHIALNNIYFTEDEKKHQYNKRAAIKHLTFLSKDLQFTDNDYTQLIFNLLLNYFPLNRPFNLVDSLINPIVFINALKEFGFLEIFPELNPEHECFVFEEAINKIKDFFSDTDKLELAIKNYLDSGSPLPPLMQALINDIDVSKDINKNDLPRFFRSMISTAVESTASFVTSFIFTVLHKYPELLTAPDNRKQLSSIANEILRIYTPVPFIYRTVRTDTVYSGINLKKGDMVILFLGTANMDPCHFESPNEIRFNRSEKHLSFGRGKYACIGEFASFRMAMNVLKHLSKYSEKIEFKDNKPHYVIHNSMLKIQNLNTVFHG